MFSLALGARLPPVIHLPISIYLINSSFFLHSAFQHFPFLIAFEIGSDYFHVFSSSPPCWFVTGCGVLCGLMCHQPVLWPPACSGWLSLVSGFGLSPPRPSSPWQVAQEHFLGRYRPSHVCPPPPVPPENSWCSVFLLTCSIQWSASTNWK